MMMMVVMMEELSTSETLVNFYKSTECNIPEDSHLNTVCCGNLKSLLSSPLWFLLPYSFIKIEKVYPLEYTDTPKVFFMSHHAGCTDVILGQCYVSDHSCTNAILGQAG
jgi:hypothetical protein